MQTCSCECVAARQAYRRSITPTGVAAGCTDQVFSSTQFFDRAEGAERKSKPQPADRQAATSQPICKCVAPPLHDQAREHARGHVHRRC